MEDNNELQNTEVEQAQEVAEQPSENLEQQQGAESVTASETQHESNSDVVNEPQINQEAVNSAINKQHAKYREEQRLRIKAEQELAQLKQQANVDPEPKLYQVDKYADDMEDELKMYRESIEARQAWEQRQKQSKADAYAVNQQQQQAEQAEIAQDAQKFMESAKQSKIDGQQLDNAIRTVGQYQLGQEVGSYLLKEDPSLTMTLSKDHQLLAELSYMSPVQRVLHIERNVKTKQPVKRETQATKPPTRVKGKVADKSDKFPLTGHKVTIE